MTIKLEQVGLKCVNVVRTLDVCADKLSQLTPAMRKRVLCALWVLYGTETIGEETDDAEE